MSLTGNVAHALLQTPAATAWLAAGAALVPPVVLLAATHSMSALVRAHVGGAIYWAALAMTVALAVCAFVLSFDALRSLAVGLGLPTSIAWLWPCAIDLAIAQATLCLLSLSRRAAASAPSVARSESRSAQSPPAHTALPREDGDPKALPALPPSNSNTSDATEEDPELFLDDLGVDEAAVRRWSPVAESLVRDGVTSKDPEVVAAILAQREAGIPPSTIGRASRVHHSTVGRILSAADALAG